VSSLYAFDALARAARSSVNKRGVTGDANSARGNAATFLLKIEGVLDGLFRDMVSLNNSEAKVSYWSMLFHENKSLRSVTGFARPVYVFAAIWLSVDPFPRSEFYHMTSATVVNKAQHSYLTLITGKDQESS
jgi:hypothetical protein